MENWNTPLVQIDGILYFVSDELVSFDLSIINGSNIDLIGYSDSQQMFLVRFNNQNRFVYKDVPRSIYEAAAKTDSIGSFMTQSVKGYFRYEQVDWNIFKASLTDVCKHYRNMQYNLNTSLGCYLTDRPDLIKQFSASETILWEFKYQEQPDNCQRIK
jgi:hypothetical protein